MGRLCLFLNTTSATHALAGHTLRAAGRALAEHFQLKLQMHDLLPTVVLKCKFFLGPSIRQLKNSPRGNAL